MIRKRRRERKISPEIQARISKLAAGRTSAAKIHREILSDFGDTNDTPSVRTVQDIVRDVRSEEPFERWSVASSSPEDAALILPVYAAVTDRFIEEYPSLGVRDAEWVVRIRKVVPDLPAFAVYEVAFSYGIRRRRDLKTDDLDSLLAFAPWRGPNAFDLYSDVARHPPAGIGFPNIGWTFALSYREMLLGLGFGESLVDEADGDYERLVELQASLDTRGRDTKTDGGRTGGKS